MSRAREGIVSGRVECLGQKTILLGWSLASASITLGVVLLGYAMLDMVAGQS